MPLIGFAEAGAGGYFDDGGFPVGKGWDEIAFPAVTDEHAYALEISGESMVPAYRDGDVIIVSPAAPVRRGDRVVVKTKNGEVMVKEFKRQTAKQVELKSLNADHPERTLSLERRGVDRAHRLGEPVSLRAARQRAVDHVDGVLHAIDRDERAEARAFLLAEQHLVEHVEPVERHAGLAVLGLLLLVEERLAAADLVDHVLNRSARRVPGKLRQRVAQIDAAPSARPSFGSRNFFAGSTKSRK